ncbi:hypothetical protein RRSWK_04535 [Rhodopirellula sp. SWK7]|nr:hypothetical protein RRSWK_04535 [Rhodopirellula sp. SWK7]
MILCATLPTTLSAYIISTVPSGTARQVLGVNRTTSQAVIATNPAFLAVDLDRFALII